MTLTVGSLFSGIGGIDLGLERAGMTVKWHSEIDPYACRVLKKHWPTTPNLGNIKDIDWSSVEPVDLIAGGYPCQPFSTAGKRQGEKDERHLWPYFLRAIGELRPRYALLENVRGHLSMGFDRVIGDLAEIGYDAEWQIVSAASVGAPHRRDRIICVAYPNDAGSGTPERGIDCDWSQEIKDRQFAQFRTSGQCKNVAYSQSDWKRGGHSKDSRTISERVAIQTTLGGSGCVVANPDSTSRQQQCEWEIQESDIGGRSENVANSNSRENGWRDGSVQQSSSFVFGRKNIGRGTQEYAGWQWWETEPDVGRVAHGIPSRVDRLRGLGNAVVPQVAEYVGRLIMEAHNG